MKLSKLACIKTIYLGILLAALSLTSSCSRPVSSAPVPTVRSESVISLDATNQLATNSITSNIQALGTIQPFEQIDLSFGVSGKALAVEVKVGSIVQNGDILAMLDTSNLEHSLQSAEAQVTIHQSELDDLHNAAQTSEALRVTAENAHKVAQAEIALRIKELQLQEELANNYYPASNTTQAQRDARQARVAIMEADIEAARLTLQKLLQWENPFLDDNSSQIEQAEARLLQAEIEVKQLQAQIAGTSITAPFDGIVSAVHLADSEFSNAGAPVITLIDNSQWFVETKNVSELDIGQIQIGHQASVEVVSFGSENISGKVVEISPVAIVQQGDTTYSLMIQLEETDLALLPGMNGSVEILLE